MLANKQKNKVSPIIKIIDFDEFKTCITKMPSNYSFKDLLLNSKAILRSYQITPKVICGESEGEYIFFIWFYESKKNKFSCLRNGVRFFRTIDTTEIKNLKDFLAQKEIFINIEFSSFNNSIHGLDNVLITHDQKKNVVQKIYNPEEMWANLPKKTRNLIRKAQKNNLIISESKDLLKDFYNFYSRGMMKKNLIPHSLQYFLAIFDLYGGQINFIGASVEEKLIAGIIFINHGDHTSYPFQASDSSYRHLAPNQLLVWEMMNRSFQNKSSYIDMGEATSLGGVFHFKKSFGGDIYDINSLSLTHFESLPDQGIYKNITWRLSFKKILLTLLSFFPIVIRSEIIAFFKSKGNLGV